jgi:cytochrome c oxidase subunit 4
LPPKGVALEHEHAQETHVVSYTTYLLVWSVLVGLTLLLSAISLMHLGGGRFNSLAAVIISPLKAALVVFYFMHLKYEKGGLRAMLVVTLGIIIIFLGLTFLDVALR